jgi:hypothetical protein
MAFSPSLQLALKGKLAEHRQREYDRLAKDLSAPVYRAGQRGKETMRQRTRMIGLKGPIWRSWNATKYPGGPSLRAASMVYTKAKEVFSTYTKGGTIRPRNKSFLVIPLAGSGRKSGIRPGFPRQRKELKDYAGQKGIRFIPLKGGRYLVVKETGRRATLLFLLVKKTQHRPHNLDFDRLMRKEHRRMATELVEAVNG